MFEGKEVRVIAAVDRNGLIGNKGGLPWPPLPRDQEWFRKHTRGNTVVMGRLTWESLPEAHRPLRNRQNIVLSSNRELAVPSDVLVKKTFFEALKASTGPHIYVIGGCVVYQHGLEYADKLVISHVDRSFVGDTYFPSYNKAMWKIEEADTVTCSLPGDLSPLFIQFTVYRHINAEELDC